MASPKILKMSWGSISLEKIGEDGKPVKGEEVVYRDAKAWPGGSCAWDWNKTGTSHWKGITREDVEDLKAKGAEVVVLTRGQWAFLHVPPEIVKELEGLNLKVIVERSPIAMETYNKLVTEGQRVAGLFHTTC
ncbi:unnamed protein product [Hydatigera taeniaeformis]|uniref:Mth938 domain-containing protein n=1 Tax=Hydatigena taeniaeformis TaxID=6205 RepID=A0A0R3X6G5_HYDTA|nr:unnamed protein product [Hydatigera taeniaeformis]